MISRNLSTYIHKIIKAPSWVIIIIMKFKEKINITITSIYNKANYNKRINRQIIDHLKKTDHIIYQIIMSDFNKNQTKSGPITKKLSNKNLINIVILDGKTNEIIWQSGT